MGKQANRMLTEVCNGYNAVAEAVIHHGPGSEVSYETGYADGWADAMHHAGWAMEKGDKLPVNKGAFPMFAARTVRRTALKLLRKRRAEARRAEKKL
jgi:hypothetical protein